ncbi:MAG: hypothetical protein KOO69_03120 [Victivallales bacterium]|nr:hypothetical protein [Victivallales bacterium]
MKENIIRITKEEFVVKFQCPGCVCGMNIDCGAFTYDYEDHCCTAHVLGTSLGVGNNFALGMPKGFNKPGSREDHSTRNRMSIRLWHVPTCPEWDKLNIPVWALEQEGFLFVRTFAPRINHSWVDVIEGGILGLCPNAINVAEFLDEID